MIPSLEVLFEDQYILCINKPAGLLSIRDGYDPSLPYVTSLLEPRYGRLWVVHRLDKGTSGLFLLARTKESHASLNTAFEHRQVHKTYHAIVVGRPPWEEFIADAPLKIDGDRNHRTVVDRLNGKPAQTKFRVLKRFGDYSLIEASPLTGYTHQIRAHLLHSGFPILADPLYTPHLEKSGVKAIPDLPIQRLALHAFALDFRHPVSSLDLHLVAEYPEDFQNALNSF